MSHPQRPSKTTRRPVLSSAGIASKTDDANIDESKLIQDMLYRIRDVNYMPKNIRNRLLEFRVDGAELGQVHPDTADMLCRIETDQAGGPVFELERDEQGDKNYLTLSKAASMNAQGDVSSTDLYKTRTDSVAAVMEKLRDDGVVTGWRDELHPVKYSFSSPPVFSMERSACGLLGVLEYGVHINGLVLSRREDGALTPRMWMARRSATKSKFPGMLDHLVAGGQPTGISLGDNVIKECWEEAGIPEALTRSNVVAAGAISYQNFSEAQKRVTRCVLFAFDLILPEDFEPKIVDGEVQEFFLWDIVQVKQSMDMDFHDPIKPNCYPIIIDYLLRHGYVSPDTPGYLDILRELRSGDCR